MKTKNYQKKTTYNLKKIFKSAIKPKEIEEVCIVLNESRSFLESRGVLYKIGACCI